MFNLKNSSNSKKLKDDPGKRIDKPLTKNSNLFVKVYNKFISLFDKNKNNKVSNTEKSILSIITEKQDADIWKLPTIDQHRLQPELEELLFIKKPDTLYQSQSSLLTTQLNKPETDKVKERLQSDAIKRNIIKANRVREQRDIALFETLSLFHTDDTYYNFKPSSPKDSPLLVNQIDHTRNFDDEHSICIW